jgi:serine/threonine protein kinase
MQKKVDYLIATLAADVLSENIDAKSILNYSQLLDQYGIDFKRAENFLLVGEVDWVQGWILDISVVQTQVIPLLKCIIPLLIQENVPFQLVRNIEIARSVLAGEFGYSTFAKIISIYPKNDEYACRLALELIKLTARFKGPQIPTDHQLGGVVYTRYGAGKPIIRTNHNNNIEEKYIYDSKGNLVKEPLTIPFCKPDGISWPFESIASTQPPKLQTILQDRYKPMAILKEDNKGSVRKGLWLEKIYKIRWCVLKEGKQNMNLDEWGRDIHDRLQWQFDLQRDLAGQIPLPKIYDFFKENGNTYLVMEFVRGVALDTYVVDILRGRPWPVQPLEVRLVLLDYAVQILDIIEKMHVLGYIHRDIMPNNFLVASQHRIWLIDLELSYSQRLQKPFPPFRLGTPGFMSPEQELAQTPTIEQDIYAIGSLLALMLTGLLPSAFSTEDPEVLNVQWNLLIDDSTFVNILVACLSSDPNSRPKMSTLKASLEEFRNRQLATESLRGTDMKLPVVKNEILKDSICNALAGLATPILIKSNQLWFARKEEEDSMAYYQSKSVSVYRGFYQGLSGVLYLLAKAKQAGFSISSCIRSYEKSLAFIRENNSGQIAAIPAGLYTGTAGMALAMVKGIETGLIQRDTAIEQDVTLYLQNENIHGCGIANGLAGKGLVLLRADEVLPNPTITASLKITVDQLLALQQGDGSWEAPANRSNKKVKITGLGHGIAGITCFLLEYLKKYKNREVSLAVEKSLHWLIRQSHNKKGSTIWYINDKNHQIDTSLDNGIAGIILSLIKAYDVLQDPLYRQLAQRVLTSIPENWMKRDLTLATGLTGIGEVYLEAANVFKSQEWQSRANWIAQFILHYVRKQKDGTYYWLTEGIPIPTAGLMQGNSGVIHLLIRFYQPDQFKHPLLA